MQKIVFCTAVFRWMYTGLPRLVASAIMGVHLGRQKNKCAIYGLAFRALPAIDPQ